MKSSLFLALQAFLFCLNPSNVHAILPRSQAQVQATENDFSLGLVNDIGSIDDSHLWSGNGTHLPGANADQVLSKRFSSLNASARTEVGFVGRSLKLRVGITQGTSSDSTPEDGLTANASYAVTAAASFRDVLRIKTSKTTTGVTVHLVFKLTGGPLLAVATNPGSVSTMNAEVRFSIDDVTKFDLTGATSSSVGIFDGSTQTFDVTYLVNLGEDDEATLEALLYLSGTVSTFYACYNGADYYNNGQGVVLHDAYVTDPAGNRVGGVKVYGDSGYVYTGKAKPSGKYSAKDKSKKVSFDTDIPESENGNDVEADFKVSLNGVKYTGTGNFGGPGSVTFGTQGGTKLQLKKKNKPTITLTLSVRERNDDYEIVGKIKQKGKSGSVSFVAKSEGS